MAKKRHYDARRRHARARAARFLEVHPCLVFPPASHFRPSPLNLGPLATCEMDKISMQHVQPVRMQVWDGMGVACHFAFGSPCACDTAVLGKGGWGACLIGMDR
jgi:hypothetical protein